MKHGVGTYKVNHAATCGVYDTKIKNQIGNYTQYTKKTKISDVVSSPGS